MRGKTIGIALIIFSIISAAAFWPREATIVGPGASPVVPAALPEAGEPLGTSEPEPPSHIVPPAVAEGIYLTGWTAGNVSRRPAILALLEAKNMNTVIIDIKDYSGYLSYHVDDPLVGSLGANKQPKMKPPEEMIKRFHANGIYVIGRLTVFQDPVVAASRPEWALKNKRTGGLWKDRKGLAWLDPAAEPVWDYAALLAKDAYARGFDEINFDYIRFPSDGILADATYPFYDGIEPKSEVMRRFFVGMRERLEGIPISADLFGLVTVATGDMGIGQILEDAAPHFDFISPMVYPSHFGTGFAGFKNPAEHPAEVITRSMSAGLARWRPGDGRYRPWLQAFDLGARYDNAAIRAQIDANAAVFASSSEAYAGYLLWDPSNRYRDL